MKKFYSNPVFLRITAFLAAEIIFLSLALACAHSPLPIKLISTSPEVRGAFSVVFVAWQFIAALLVTDLLLRIFSEEWSFYLTRHPFYSGCDAVSTLTANIFFHIRHAVTHSTSLAYKAAFAALAVITILRTMAPASITTAVFPVSYSEVISLAKYNATTFDPTDHNDPVMASIQRAEVITRVEQEMGADVGWKVADNALVGRQEKEVLAPNVTTIYPSDVVMFDYRCTWAAPQVQQGGNGIIFSDNGTQWRAWNARNASDITIGIYPLYNVSGHFTGQSAYLFVGCNGTNERVPCLLEMVALPSTMVPTPPQPRVTIVAPPNLFISLLTCDPNYNLTTSHVIASGSTLSVNSSEHLPPQNNLPGATAELILSSALLSVLSPLSPGPGMPTLLSTTAARVFLDVHGQDINSWIGRMNFTADILDLNAIQQNMNTVMVSASKAFLIKPSGQMGESFTGFETVKVPAIIKKPAILLVGSKSFIFSTIGLISLIIFCGCLIFLDTRTQDRLPLDLHTILIILKHGSISGSVVPGDLRKSIQEKPLPLIMEPYAPLALNDDDSEAEEQHENRIQWYWPRRYIFARVITFLVLQLGFYGFAIAGHVRPYNITRASPIPLANYFAELKGAFIIVFTAWHTLSIAFLSDVILTVFSLEWVVQAEKKCVLEPGQTDRVSSPASGIFDRVKYAFTKGQGASGMFRYALGSSIVLMLLAATGPGCFTLSTTAVVNQNINLLGGKADAGSFLAMSLGPGPLIEQQATLLKRIADITQLEQLEGFTWGYETPPNVFVSWPYDINGKLIHQQAAVKYQSTVRAISFKVNCRWETPLASDLVLQNSIAKPITSGVAPVSFRNITRTAYGHFGLLVVGCANNSTGQTDCALDMTGVQGAQTDNNEAWHGAAALLACDPSKHNFNALPKQLYLAWNIDCAQLSLTDSRINAKIQPCGTSGIYNVPNEPGNIFASSLLFALQPPSFVVGNSTPGAIGIGLLAGQLLFDNYTATLGSNLTRSVSNIQLFDVETKLDKYLTSATKVFMAGYNPSLDRPSSGSTLSLSDSNNGTIATTVDQMTLVGNKAMIITSMILLVIALRLLQLSLRSVFWKQSRVRVLEPFGIASVARMEKWLMKVERLRNED